MGTVAEAAAILETALRTLDTIAVYHDLVSPLATPAVMIGPPSLRWETGCVDPTEATFIIRAIVQRDERSIERLWDLVVAVAAKIDETPAVVTSATPGIYPSSAGDLPCYEITTEMSLI